MKRGNGDIPIFRALWRKLSVIPGRGEKTSTAPRRDSFLIAEVMNHHFGGAAVPGVPGESPRSSRRDGQQVAQALNAIEDRE
jgi:hypothetical protein